MIDAIAQFFGVLISFIYDYVPNLGLAIIIMTVLVKIVTFPLNNKQIQSAKRMQQLQPEMKKIQQKYKDDKEKQNQAVSEFMKENNMNPLAGCLPLLVQFPILIGIFRLLREANEFLDMSVINPYLFPSAQFIDLLAVPNIGFDNFLSQISIYYIFPLIAGATTYIYSKMSMSTDSSQKMMLYMMPIMITVFSFSFPVGLVIYWIMNNVFSIGQHKFIVKMDQVKEDGKADEVSKSNGRENSKPESKKALEKTESNKKPEPKGAKSKAKKGKGKK
ncbi:MAG: YidC/Oxa1 family membrane protein insertase [Bacillota bacterium]|nr:YidC/Oxa1 family membrane protein insertase [Bacillota bacterium]MDW7729039.1 YidC/Oxa1 family membrane protein insertase [Bacillota bacterium]